MPARPNRTRTNANASTGPVEVERTTASAPTPAAPPTPRAPVATEQAKPRKFTALLDAPTDSRYGRLLDQLRDQLGPVATRSDGYGRTRAGYDVSRADLLRALLEVADDDPSVMNDVRAKVQSHYGATA